jgi:hypothetical protein
MQQRTLLRTLTLLGLASAALALPLLAQDNPSDSVAEAARRARAQKKAATKPATVITDDTLKPAPASSSSAATSADSAVSPTPATPSDAGTAAASADAQAHPNNPSAEDKEKKAAEMEALKQQIAAMQSQVDLAQRELTLDSDAYYSKPNYQGDKAGAVKIAAEQANVNQKKDELAALKAKLATLGPLPPATTAPPKP